jgi:hypothetical protein
MRLHSCSSREGKFIILSVETKRPILYVDLQSWAGQTPGDLTSFVDLGFDRAICVLSHQTPKISDLVLLRVAAKSNTKLGVYRPA